MQHGINCQPANTSQPTPSARSLVKSKYRFLAIQPYSQQQLNRMCTFTVHNAVLHQNCSELRPCPASHRTLTSQEHHQHVGLKPQTLVHPNPATRSAHCASGLRAGEQPGPRAGVRARPLALRAGQRVRAPLRGGARQRLHRRLRGGDARRLPQQAVAQRQRHRLARPGSGLEQRVEVVRGVGAVSEARGADDGVGHAAGLQQLLRLALEGEHTERVEDEPGELLLALHARAGHVHKALHLAGGGRRAYEVARGGEVGGLGPVVAVPALGGERGGAGGAHHARHPLQQAGHLPRVAQVRGHQGHGRPVAVQCVGVARPRERAHLVPALNELGGHQLPHTTSGTSHQHQGTRWQNTRMNLHHTASAWLHAAH
mmetsp:Transcript_37979/g.96048  ORF Transcript_37979/g.96048 Transcript_37979/m.96048 type:complete len:371 (+) Transcript_37979:1496-2608(+)